MNSELVIVALMAAGGSFLSFFSGFGLGTLLLPAFLLFFPVEIAVAASAVVHMLNNVFKLFLVGKYANWKIVVPFGLFSILGAFGGAKVLELLSGDIVLHTYTLSNHSFDITLIKVVIAVIVGAFAYLENSEKFKHATIGPKWMPVGGIVSGFFGGLSGHQGALRSAFLIKAGMTKEAFMGTRVVIACLVDLTRIAVYYTIIKGGLFEMNKWPVVVATLAAFLGAYYGNRWMKKKELSYINRFVQVTLIIFAVCLGLGWL
jgi:uncharacterized membrane protein YfcA